MLLSVVRSKSRRSAAETQRDRSPGADTTQVWPYRVWLLDIFGHPSLGSSELCPSEQTVLMPNQHWRSAYSALSSVTAPSCPRLPVLVSPAGQNAVNGWSYLRGVAAAHRPLVLSARWRCPAGRAVSGVRAALQAAAGCVQEPDFTAAHWCCDFFLWTCCLMQFTCTTAACSRLSFHYVSVTHITHHKCAND